MATNITSHCTSDRYFRHLLVIVGEPGVGKSSLVARYTTGTFNQDQEPTIGATFLTKTVEGGKLDIWDISGEQDFQIVAPLLLRSPQTAVIVYDVTNRESFLKVNLWIAQIEAIGRSAPVIVLVGNKSDLSDQRAVDVEEGIRLAEERQLMFVETSAKTAYNLDILFDVIIVDRLTPLLRPEIRTGEDEDFVFLADDVIDSSSCVVAVKPNFIDILSAELVSNVQTIMARFHLFKRKRIIR